MLQNAYFLAKIGADTAENEQHFAEILPKIGNYPTGPLRAGRGAHRGLRGRRGLPLGRLGAAGPNGGADRLGRGTYVKIKSHKAIT